jgi:hypothetical protein
VETAKAAQEVDMQTTRLTALTTAIVAVMALATPTSQAQDRSLTRAEVKAELVRAQASGELRQMRTNRGFTDVQQEPRSAPSSENTGASGRPYSEPAKASDKRAPLPTIGFEGS